MRNKIAIGLAASALALTLSPAALAQHGGGGGGGGAGGAGGMGMGSMSGMQTMRGDVDRIQDRTRAKDTTGGKAQDRDRLKTYQSVSDQLTGLGLMSSGERQQMRSEMQAATTAQQRDMIRAEHQKMIQDRAKLMGVDAPMMGAGTRSRSKSGSAGTQDRSGYMLMQMLSEQERMQYYNRLRGAATEPERQTIRTEMHNLARERAQQMGVDVPAWFGAGTGAGPR